MLSYPSVYTGNLGTVFLPPDKNLEICHAPLLHHGYWPALSLRWSPALRRGQDWFTIQWIFIQILTRESANETNVQVTEENHFLIDHVLQWFFYLFVFVQTWLLGNLWLKPPASVRQGNNCLPEFLTQEVLVKNMVLPWKISQENSRRGQKREEMTNLPEYITLESILAERCMRHQKGPWITKYGHKQEEWPETTRKLTPLP